MAHEDEGRDHRRSRQDDADWEQSATRRDPDRPAAEPDPNDSGVSPGRHLDHGSDPPALDEVDQLIGVEYSAPIPPPGLIAEYDRLYPGSGQRIMDDAHENQVLDRYVTTKSFETSLFLERAGFVVATGIVLVCLGLMAFSVLVVENVWAAALFGLSGGTPMVLGFLGNRRR